MAIDRSRTETIRDFTVHTPGVSVSLVGAAGGKGLLGRGAPFLAMASLCDVVAGGNTTVGAGDDRRRARF